MAARRAQQHQRRPFPRDRGEWTVIPPVKPDLAPEAGELLTRPTGFEPVTFGFVRRPTLDSTELRALALQIAGVQAICGAKILAVGNGVGNEIPARIAETAGPGIALALPVSRSGDPSAPGQPLGDESRQRCRGSRAGSRGRQRAARLPSGILRGTAATQRRMCTSAAAARSTGSRSARRTAVAPRAAGPFGAANPSRGDPPGVQRCRCRPHGSTVRIRLTQAAA